MKQRVSLQLPERLRLSSVAFNRSPEQKKQNNDHDQQAHTTTIVMEWRTKIETAASEKEDENNQ
jgi:hypothetical protein